MGKIISGNRKGNNSAKIIFFAFFYTLLTLKENNFFCEKIKNVNFNSHLSCPSPQDSDFKMYILSYKNINAATKFATNL